MVTIRKRFKNDTNYYFYGMEKIYEYISNNPKSTITDISQALNKDRHTIAKYLEKLESQGLITWEPKGRSKQYTTTTSPLLQTINKNNKLNKELQNVLKTLNKNITIHEGKHNVHTPNGMRKCYEYRRNRETPCPNCPAPKTINTGKTQSTNTIWNGEKKKITTHPFKNFNNKTVGIIEIIEEE